MLVEERRCLQMPMNTVRLLKPVSISNDAQWMNFEEHADRSHQGRESIEGPLRKEGNSKLDGQPVKHQFSRAILQQCAHISPTA